MSPRACAAWAGWEDRVPGPVSPLELLSSVAWEGSSCADVHFSSPVHHLVSWLLEYFCREIGLCPNFSMSKIWSHCPYKLFSFVTSCHWWFLFSHSPGSEPHSALGQALLTPNPASYQDASVGGFWLILPLILLQIFSEISSHFRPSLLQLIFLLLGSLLYFIILLPG